MATITLLLGCLVLLSLDQTFANPEFPTFPDDYMAKGIVRMKGTIFRFNCWFSKSLKSSRVDSYYYEKIEKRYTLENEGSYGTDIFVEIHIGRTLCSAIKGTDMRPIKYESYLSFFSQKVKYIGIENVNGINMQKWQYSYEDQTGTILIREDENGPVPYIIDSNETSVQFETFSSTSPPARVFKKKRCGRHSKRAAIPNILEFK